MSTWELPGLWTHRSFNPAYVWGDQTDQRELDLLVAEAEVNLKGAVDPLALEGTIEWPGVPPGGLDLNGTAQPGVGGELASFEITGSGRPGTNTAGWEYRYEGHLTRRWPDGINQVPTLVGSVIRVKDHNGSPPRSPAGVVYSFIAVKHQQPLTWELPGSWIYRSFHNWARYVYQTAPQIAQPRAHELILQDAVFKFETRTSTTLQGAIEWNVGHGRNQATGGGLNLNGTVQPGAADEPSTFEIVGTGRPGTDTAGWEYRYQGHETRRWVTGIEQLPALVGSVIRVKAHAGAPAGYVAPFIAVKQPPSR